MVLISFASSVADATARDNGSADVPVWASRELQTLGKIRREELSMAALVVLALSLWIAGRAYVHSTTVVLILLSLMVLTGIVRWDDVLAYKPAWNALIWFATLVTLADGLNRVGFVDWIAVTVASSLTGVSPTVVMVI